MPSLTAIQPVQATAAVDPTAPEHAPEDFASSLMAAEGTAAPVAPGDDENAAATDATLISAQAAMVVVLPAQPAATAAPTDTSNVLASALPLTDSGDPAAPVGGVANTGAGQDAGALRIIPATPSASAKPALATEITGNPAPGAIVPMATASTAASGVDAAALLADLAQAGDGTVADATAQLQLRAMQTDLATAVADVSMQATATSGAAASPGVANAALSIIDDVASSVAALHLRQRGPTGQPGDSAAAVDFNDIASLMDDASGAVVVPDSSAPAVPTADLAAAQPDPTANASPAAPVDALAGADSSTPAIAAPAAQAPQPGRGNHLDRAEALTTTTAAQPAVLPSPSVESRPAPAPVTAPARQAPAHTVQSEANAMDRAIAGQVARAAGRIAAGEGPILVVRLTPAELGTVRIELRESGGQLTARLHAEDPAVRETLERMLPTVRNDLRAGDSRLADVAVSPPSQADRQERQQQQQSQSNQDGARDDRRQSEDGRGERRRRAQQAFLDALAAVPNGTAAA